MNILKAEIETSGLLKRQENGKGWGVVLGKSWATSWASIGTGFWIPGPHISATRACGRPPVIIPLENLGRSGGGYDKNALDAL